MTKQWQPLPDGMKYYEARGLAYSILDNGEAFVAGVEQGSVQIRWPDNVKVCELVEVEDWQPPIPWELVPPEAEWLTIDPDGEWTWHTDEPIVLTKVGFWHSDGTLDSIHPNGSPDPLCATIPLGTDWRQCKWRRPEVRS